MHVASAIPCTKKNSIARKKCRTVWEKQGSSGVGGKSRYWGRCGGVEPVQTVCIVGWADGAAALQPFVAYA
eukprot:COSAG02_NODE_2966_length_7642_cov_6.384330_5_plen_71_part_00